MTDKKIRVGLICNWSTSKDLCNEFSAMSQDSNLNWNNLEFTYEVDDIDYYVIINHPGSDTNYLPNKTIIFQMEPQSTVNSWGIWAKPDINSFLQVRSHDRYLNNCQSQLMT